jgi:hypothetical protein
MHRKLKRFGGVGIEYKYLREKGAHRNIKKSDFGAQCLGINDGSCY